MKALALILVTTSMALAGTALAAPMNGDPGRAKPSQQGQPSETTPSEQGPGHSRSPNSSGTARGASQAELNAAARAVERACRKSPAADRAAVCAEPPASP